jgi:hypothetical protein
MDTAASMVFVLLAVAAAPAMALLDPPPAVVRLVGLGFIGYALALAAMGAVTACTLMSSMRRGRFELPPRLWLPLPRRAQPFPGGRTISTARARDRRRWTVCLRE